MDLQSIRFEVNAEVEKLSKVLRALDGIVEPEVGPSGKSVKRHLSASARRRISLAQKARWARQKQTIGRIKKAA